MRGILRKGFSWLAYFSQYYAGEGFAFFALLVGSIQKDVATLKSQRVGVNFSDLNNFFCRNFLEKAKTFFKSAKKFLKNEKKFPEYFSSKNQKKSTFKSIVTLM